MQLKTSDYSNYSLQSSSSIWYYKNDMQYVCIGYELVYSWLHQSIEYVSTLQCRYSQILQILMNMIAYNNCCVAIITSYLWYNSRKEKRFQMYIIYVYILKSTCCDVKWKAIWGITNIMEQRNVMCAPHCMLRLIVYMF